MDASKLLLGCTLLASVCSIGIDHDWKKNNLIRLEEFGVMGAKLPLVGTEKQMNKIFMNYKQQEVDDGIKDPHTFLPFLHFFYTQPQIAQRTLYKLLRMFPKGASLHLHDFGAVSSDFIFKLTFQPNLYICFIDGQIHFKFKLSSSKDTTCHWTLLSHLRATNFSIDGIIKKQLTMVVPNVELAYPDAKVVWDTIYAIVNRIYDLVTYRPVWKLFIYQAFKECLDDNIMYVELKSILPNLYDLDGTTYGALFTAQAIKDIVSQFVADHPTFLGARLIYAPIRSADNATAERYATTAIQLKKQFPDFFAGFDLVGWEDAGQPLEAFIFQLEEMKKHGIQFFFHAGETNLYGTQADRNLFDAVLLGSHRLGDPVALIKHPEVLKLVKIKNIGLEMLPISNQVFQLVPDFRSNPAAHLIASDYPVIIGSDTPGIWGATGLSYDWYITFLSLTGRDIDTKVLKQFALNSIEQSAMPLKEKAIALKVWTKRFIAFSEAVVDYNSVQQSS